MGEIRGEVNNIDKDNLRKTLRSLTELEERLTGICPWKVSFGVVVTSKLTVAIPHTKGDTGRRQNSPTEGFYPRLLDAVALS